MNKFLPFLAFFLCLAPVHVSASSFYSVDGDKFTVEYNEHGAILTSEFEKYFPAEDSGDGMKKTKLMLYLGVQCDAYSQNYGNGKWNQSTGGFVIRFDHKAFGFIRQEIAIPHGGKCLMRPE
jgi:hypothetical protein